MLSAPTTRSAASRKEPAGHPARDEPLPIRQTQKRAPQFANLSSLEASPLWQQTGKSPLNSPLPPSDRNVVSLPRRMLRAARYTATGYVVSNFADMSK